MNGHAISICVTPSQGDLGQRIITKIREKGKDVDEIKCEIKTFASGEWKPLLHSSVRGKTVFLISSGSEIGDTEVMRNCLFMDALERSGVDKFILVQPYYDFCRQDKIGDDERSCISAEVAARMYQMFAGFYGFMTVHLHNKAIKGFFKKEVFHIGTKRLLFEEMSNYYIEKDGKFNPKEWKLIHPDAGAANEVRDFAIKYGFAGTAGFTKVRNQVEVNHIDEIIFNCKGLIRGYRAAQYDDIFDTGGTMVKTGDYIFEEEGVEELVGMGSHILLNKNAPHILQDSRYAVLFGTDTRFIEEKKKFPKLHLVSIDSSLARCIMNIHNGESVRYEDW